MKIELNGAYRAYAKAGSTLPPAGEKHAEKGGRIQGQLDRVSISSEAAQKGELDRLAHTAAAEAEASVPAGKLAELRQAVAEGTYRVPTEKLADAVLSAYV